MLSLFVFLFLSSCQVKDSAPGGGLISGHKPTTNSFSLEAPTAKNYTTGEVLTLTYAFPYDIVVDTTSGSPRLRLTIGATTRYADFVDQPTPKKLRFSYTIQATEEDLNGVDINALELNGSTLQFDDKGTMTNCNVASVGLTNLSNQKVDTVAAEVSQFNFNSLPGYYRAGDKVMFTATFDEKVYVTGFPYFVADIGVNTVNFSYEAGSGTNILTFSYVVTDTDEGASGAFDSITSPIVLNGGTIKDSVGNNALLTFDPTNARTSTAAIRIIGNSPYVVGVTVPENNTYPAGSTLEVILEFNRSVNVLTATPYIELTIGSNTRQAALTAGAGTKFLTFSYTLNPGDVSTGITVKSSITQNGATIRNATAPTNKNYFINFATFNNNTFIVPDTSGIICNAIQPQAISATRAADTTIPKWGGTSPDNKWIIGQELFITVNFNTLIQVTQDDGVPSIDVVLDSSTVQAPFHSGNGQSSLIFRYVIKETDVDSGSITLGNINLNGGVLTDGTTNVATTLPAAAITNTIIDGIRPVITGINPPTAKTYSTQATVNDANMLFTINWSEPVNYSSTSAVTNTIKIPMDVGGAATPLQYNGGNNSAAITHKPASLAGLNDIDGVTLSSPLTLTGTAVISDQAGNAATNFAFALPDTSGVLVDTIIPSVQSIDVITADGTYKAGDTIDLEITFTEPVTLSRAGTFPQVAISIGGVSHIMEALGDGEATTHTFRYEIASGDNDVDGVSIGSAIVLGGGSTIRDRGLNPATLTFSAPDTSGIIVDTTAPSITDATPSAAKAYVSGEDIEITVTFDEPVFVTGIPRIDVDFYAGPDHLIYVNGDGTTTLTFRRTLDPDHFDMNGLGSVNTINAGIGTIKDSVGNDATRSFTAINLANYYVTYPQVTLWVKNALENLAPSATATATDNTGGNLTLNQDMSNIEHVFLKLTTPGILGDHAFFMGDFELENDGFGFDIRTAPGETAYDGTVLNAGTFHDTNFALSTNHFMHVQFNPLTSYLNGNTILSNSFDGSINDVIAVKSGLNSDQVNNLRAYLGF